MTREDDKTVSGNVDKTLPDTVRLMSLIFKVFSESGRALHLICNLICCLESYSKRAVCKTSDSVPGSLISEYGHVSH